MDALSKSGIYEIRCLVTNKVYIGSSINIKARWASHLGALRRGSHHSIKLQRAWAKYGEKNFILTILEEVLNLDFLIVREQWWIDKTTCAVNGYNICPSADSPKGTKQSPETIAKKIKANTGKKRTREQCERISKGLKGFRHPPEFYEKLSKTLRGRKHTEEHRLRNSLGHKGISPSVETRAKLSNANKGVPFTQERKDNIRKALNGKVPYAAMEAARKVNIGKKHPQHVRDKISNAHVGKKLTKEHIQRLIDCSTSKKRVLCVTTNQVFASISSAAKWLISNSDKPKNYDSAVSGISLCVNNKREVSFGYRWVTYNCPLDFPQTIEYNG